VAKKTLVTGRTRQDGSPAVELLLREDHETRGSIRRANILHAVPTLAFFPLIALSGWTS
jgi:GDP-D-mannose dehydratase